MRRHARRAARSWSAAGRATSAPTAAPRAGARRAYRDPGSGARGPKHGGVARDFLTRRSFSEGGQSRRIRSAAVQGCSGGPAQAGPSLVRDHACDAGCRAVRARRGSSFGNRRRSNGLERRSPSGADRLTIVRQIARERIRRWESRCRERKCKCGDHRGVHHRRERRRTGGKVVR
jgi:hypothetical protein